MNSDPNLVNLLVAYIEEDRKHGFDLKDGTECLGWLGMEYEADGNTIDCNTDYVWFQCAPGPFDAPDADAKLSEEVFFQGVKIPMASIDLNTLYYWDYARWSGWHKFDSVASI